MTAAGSWRALNCDVWAGHRRLQVAISSRYTSGMDLHVTPDLQAKLVHLAARQGRDTGALVQDALARYIEDQTRFLEGVERGITASEGEFIDEDEMDARVAQMLKP